MERPEIPSGSFRAVVVWWERHRITYNAILFVAGIVVLLWYARNNVHPAFLVFGGISMAMGANSAYLLGPLTELYLCAIFNLPHLDNKWRYLFFGGGVAFSLVVFALFLPVGTLL